MTNTVTRVLIIIGVVLGAAVGLLFLSSIFTYVELTLAKMFNLGGPFGISSQTTQQYAFTSGPGPNQIAALGFAGVLVTAWRHLNCHAPRCLRIGRYPTEGGEFKLCHSHHPDHQDGHPTLEEMHASHRARKAAKVAPAKKAAPKKAAKKAK